MGRHPKTGLDYFPKDVDYWDDFRIMDLMNKYGPLGAVIYDIVISKVYKNGYYLEVPLEKLASQIIRLIGNRWIKKQNPCAASDSVLRGYRAVRSCPLVAVCYHLCGNPATLLRSDCEEQG